MCLQTKQIYVRIEKFVLEIPANFLVMKIKDTIMHIVSDRIMCILYNQRDATYTMFFIIISALHVSDGFSAHHQELIKLYVQPCVLSCFPAVYRWCGLGGTVQQESMTIHKAAYTVL